MCLWCLLSCTPIPLRQALEARVSPCGQAFGMATLEGQKESVQAQLRQISQELRRAKKVLKTTQSQDELNPRRCQALNTAVVIFSITAPITHIAVDYLRFMRPKSKHEEESSVKTLLDYYNEFSIADKGLMLEPYDETWGVHVERAHAWLRDHELRNWVTEQNVSKGVAPSHKQVWLQKQGAAGQDSSGALRPNRSAHWKSRQKNQWIRRWAKRHKVFQGTFKSGERLPLKTLQTKAPGFEKGSPPKPKMRPKSGHEIVAGKRSRNEDHMMTRKRQGWPVSGPDFVSPFGANFRFQARLFSGSRSGFSDMAVEQFLGISR